jgi:hypothetical protein
MPIIATIMLSLLITITYFSYQFGKFDERTKNGKW